MILDGRTGARSGGRTDSMPESNSATVRLCVRPTVRLLRRRRDPVPGEEVLDLGAYMPPAPRHLLGAGEPVEDLLAVSLLQHPRVHQDHYPDIGAAPDQPSEPLLQLEGGVREEIPREAILPLLRQALESRRGDRFTRDLERQLGEHERTQRPPRDVDPFPEGVGAKEDRVPRIAEAAEEEIAIPFSLHQEGPLVPQHFARAHRCGLQRRVAGEEDEHPAVRRVGQVAHHVDDSGGVPARILPGIPNMHWFGKSKGDGRISSMVTGLSSPSSPSLFLRKVNSPPAARVALVSTEVFTLSKRSARRIGARSRGTEAHATSCPFRPLRSSHRTRCSPPFAGRSAAFSASAAPSSRRTTE